MDIFKKLEYVLIFIILISILFLFFSAYNSGAISGFFVEDRSLPSPSDFVKDGNIEVEKDGVLIKIDRPVLTKFENSGSMAPFLGEGATGIEKKPSHEDELYVGDVVTFAQDGVLVVHRIVEKGVDEQGVYFITKGDNNNIRDEKIRFSQIQSVLVGVIY
ncbi:MAG TPA: signal peptidase I [Candidatus Nanoarchaeia archaeon]|nr:signal peptidase I [Candidatus Nanoarchaeia archaeon]